MRFEYCERNIGEMEDRIHAAEARREAMERFCPPTSKVETIRPDQLYWHELLTAAASLLEEIAGRELGDEPAMKLANLYREQAAGFSRHMKMPPVKFVRGA